MARRHDRHTILLAVGFLLGAVSDRIEDQRCRIANSESTIFIIVRNSRQQHCDDAPRFRELLLPVGRSAVYQILSQLNQNFDDFDSPLFADRLSNRLWDRSLDLNNAFCVIDADYPTVLEFIPATGVCVDGSAGRSGHNKQYPDLAWPD